MTCYFNLFQTPCEHLFCRACMDAWLNERPVCPVDQLEVRPDQLRPAPRIVRNMLGQLQLKCRFYKYVLCHRNKKIQAYKNMSFTSDLCFSLGCKAVITLNQLAVHEASCAHDPSKLVKCQKEGGCGLEVPQGDIKVSALRQVRA